MHENHALAFECVIVALAQQRQKQQPIRPLRILLKTLCSEVKGAWQTPTTVLRMLLRMVQTKTPQIYLRSVLLDCILPSMQRANFSVASGQEHLKVSLEAGLGMITIDRPKALNAKNCGMRVVPLRARSFNPLLQTLVNSCESQKWLRLHIKHLQTL